MTRKGIRICIQRYAFRGHVDVAPVLWPKWFIWRDGGGQWHCNKGTGTRR